MAKSPAEIKEKMERRMRNAGADVKSGFQNGTDPMEVIAKDTAGYGKAVATGVQKAVENGSYAKGIQKAKDNQSWRKSGEKAAANYVNAAGVAASNYMEGYSDRMNVINAALAKNPRKAGETRAERIARAAKYQEDAGKGFDSLYGRK